MASYPVPHKDVSDTAMTSHYTSVMPPHNQPTNLHTFMDRVNAECGLSLKTYDDLWRWSVDRKEDFWSMLWDDAGIIAAEKGATVFAPTDKMKDSRFFPEARLNFAENLLRRRDDDDALVFRAEDKVKRRVTFNTLYDTVSQLAQALRAMGVMPGDRVAGFLPNMPEAIIAMLATSSIGAVWSSASPDFGVQGVLDRFGQIEPKVLLAADHYYYNGKTQDCLDKLGAIMGKLPSLQKTIVIPFNGEVSGDVPQEAELWGEVIAPYEPQDIEFEQLAFDHPLYIMFSSGTTGVPKCIVHGQGGTLLQQVKEHRYQSNVSQGDRVFYFTTCGWMMWNWLVAGLAAGASLMLYDGSPFYPNGYTLFEYAEDEKFTLFGTSAKFIDALKNHDLRPSDKHDLSSVRLLASTGSPLVHEAFDYIYEHIKPDIHIASISGGTDIVSCFVLGNPFEPVYRGEIQGAGLGMDVDVFDHDGNPVRGEKGELVCKTPFPCMPISFWGDKDGTRYHSAYFDRFDNIWCHGDYCEITENGGFIIHGRSDATLNPGGVRIGTAEIYRQVEKLPEIKESICVGQDWKDDVRVVLFVVLHDGVALDEALKASIKSVIRKGASPRHVPAKIIPVVDIPRTKSGKITELAVRDIIHGREIKNKEALANPEALALYKNLEALEK